MSKMHVRGVRVDFTGMPNRRFDHNGISWSLSDTAGVWAPWGGLYVLLNLQWNPQWGRFHNVGRLQIVPVRFLGMVLGGVAVGGVPVLGAVQKVAALPNDDNLPAATVRLIAPFVDAVEKQLKERPVK